jgi:hypothetical protein
LLAGTDGALFDDVAQVATFEALPGAESSDESDAVTFGITSDEVVDVVDKAAFAGEIMPYYRTLGAELNTQAEDEFNPDAIFWTFGGIALDDNNSDEFVPDEVAASEDDALFARDLVFFCGTSVPDAEGAWEVVNEWENSDPLPEAVLYTLSGASL